MSLHDEVRGKTSRENVVIPSGLFIRHIPAKVARGAHKPKGNAIVGSNSWRVDAMRPASNVVRTLAAKGW